MRSTILYIVYIIVFIFLALEIILRIYNPFPKRLRIDKIILPVNQHVIIKNVHNLLFLEKIAYSNKNSLGFRGPEIPLNFDSCFSLITVGGSTTECYYLSDSLTWPYLLGKYLSHDIKNLWINNAGLDGHSTFGHQILLDDYLLKIKPKFILFLVGANDVERKDLNNWDKRFISKGWKGLLERSEVVVLALNLSRVIRAKQYKIANDYKSLRTMKSDTISFPDEYCKTKLLSQTPYIKGYQDRLLKIINTCRENNITPIFVTQPSLFGKGSDDVTGCDLEKKNIYDGTNGKLYWERLELYNEVTRNICRQHNLILIDLAHELPKSYLYLYDALHYTLKGSQKVAEIIYQDLKKTPEINQYFNE